MTTPPTAVRRLMPQDLDDWTPLVLGHNPKPTIGTSFTQADRQAIDVYNQRIGTIPTQDTRRVRDAIRQAHFENDYSAFGSATCVIVNGQALSGKTHAVLTHAFSETRHIWSSLDHEPDEFGHTRSIPWVYVEVPKSAQGASIVRAIWSFMQPPPLPARASTNDYLEAIRRIAPEIGLRGVILDDSHGVGLKQSSESRLLADTLKTLLTGLPATVVLIGNGFHESGVLHGSAGEQVRLRSAKWIEVGAWPRPQPGVIGDWERLAAGLTARLLLPPRRQVRLNRRKTIERLAEGSFDHPGLAVRWVKRAATYAIKRDTDLDIRALEATHQGTTEDVVG